MSTSRILITVLTAPVLAAALLVQTGDSKDLKPDEPQETKVYYRGVWEVGELKDCVTLWDAESLLLCHESWFDKEIECIGTGRSRAECHKQAIADIRHDSKSFLVKFSEKPWPRKEEKGWWYKCSKGETISCKREEVPK